MTVIKTEPGDSEATPILPDPGCGPIKREDFLLKEEQEQTSIKEEIVAGVKWASRSPGECWMNVIPIEQCFLKGGPQTTSGPPAPQSGPPSFST